MDRSGNWTKKEYTIVYVMGAGHSGSTLLNLLLNGHSRVVGLCELDSLNRRLRAPDEPLYPLVHSFWKDVARCWESNTGCDFLQISIETPTRKRMRMWSEGEQASYTEQNERLFDCIVKLSGATHIVDTSRSRRRLELLARNERLSLKVIHLVRDGRGVVNSYRRKYGRLHIGLRRWIVPTLFGLAARKKMRDLDWIKVRYEDLAGNPEATLRELCTFIEIDFEHEMLRYWEKEDVSIGGNRMRETKKPVRLDERWRVELSLRERLVFIPAGAWLNRLLGYPILAAYRPGKRMESLPECDAGPP